MPERNSISAFATGQRGWMYVFRAITIRKMRKKWASCSTAGRLTFEESLLSKSLELQDYVIVHELLHVDAPNHSKLWKILMRAHLGNYERYEEELRSKT